MNKHLTLFAVVLAGVVGGACANDGAERQSLPAPSQQVAQLAEQHIASIKKSQSQEAAYYTNLATTTSRESRNEAWASDMEAKLKKSYAETTHVSSEGLKSVKCYSSNCALQLKLDTSQPHESAQQWQAINEWIAWSQPCGYDMTAESPDLLRVFLHCAK